MQKVLTLGDQSKGDRRVRRTAQHHDVSEVLGQLIEGLMRNGKDAGRIPGEEYQGAMYLALSMLNRVGTSDDPDVNSAVDELNAAAGTNEVDPDSGAWTSAFAVVSEACTAVLGEFGVSAGSADITSGWI
jgi:hypothetical protein